MQSQSRFLDDMAQLVTNAMGVAHGARGEAETAFRSLMERWMTERDFVSREEFDAVEAMARRAREENAELAARVAALEARLEGGGGPAA